MKLLSSSFLVHSGEWGSEREYYSPLKDPKIDPPPPPKKTEKKIIDLSSTLDSVFWILKGGLGGTYQGMVSNGYL